MPPGTNLDAMSDVALKADKIITGNPEVDVSALTVGPADGDPNSADFYVHLVNSHKRTVNTSQLKDRLRSELKELAYANPVVKDYDAVGGGMRPFMLNILGDDQKQLEDFGNKLKGRLKKHPALLDVDVNFRSGKPEFQVQPDKNQAQKFGMSAVSIGQELRAQVEGVTPAKYRENGLEYDVRVRLQEDQRDLRQGFKEAYVSNLNGSLVPLSKLSEPIDAEGPSKITRQDRRRYVQIAADIRPGMGMGDAMKDIDQLRGPGGDLELPPGMSHKFIEQAEDFQELGENMAFAVMAGVLFIFLVLASLYESFVTPFTIMLAMPLAICGCFGMLFLATKRSIFSP